METIGTTELWTYLSRTVDPITSKCVEIRKSEGVEVGDYMDLVARVASLQFHNREHVLLFRGQSRDYRNQQRNTTLKPSLFRPVPGETANPDPLAIEMRFQTLRLAEEALVRRYANGGFRGLERIKRQRVLRWSLLQHYEVCPTPVLDVTQSLRAAASFASVDDETDFAYLFVLGVPNISGAVTASAEAGLQIIRLSSVCPPAALRPHIQEGFLLAEYPPMESVDQKQNYGAHEIDFGRRLVAKFRFNPASFWKGTTFPRFGHRALYPNKNDPIFALARALRDEIG